MCLSCICLLVMHTLICVTFSLPPGVRGWLRLLLVALPGLFCLPFFTDSAEKIIGVINNTYIITDSRSQLSNLLNTHTLEVFLLQRFFVDCRIVASTVEEKSVLARKVCSAMCVQGGNIGSVAQVNASLLYIPEMNIER